MPRPAEIVLALDNRSRGISYWQAGDQHSRADRHGVSLAPYIHALFGLIRQRPVRSVLMIGCGGGTLATLLVRAGIAVSLVDIDPASFAIARGYFHLPDSVTCHVADGAKFLRRSSARYDAIVLDAFAGKTIPPHLLTDRFFRLVKARLRPGGIFLVNVVTLDQDDFLADDIAETMDLVWRQVRVLDMEGMANRNILVVAGAVKELRRPRLMIKPAIAARALTKSLRRYSFRTPR